jgi:hypothetical protein
MKTNREQKGMTSEVNMTDEELENAESFWSRKDAAEKHMGRDELFTEIGGFLTSHKVCALACGGKILSAVHRWSISGMITKFGFLQKAV